MDHHQKDKEPVMIELKRAEALVLFDLLARWESEKLKDTMQINYPAERRVLWDILARLESMLDEPFRPDYQDLVSQARQAVQDSEE